MSYHVALDLNLEQVRSLKLLATGRDQSVKDLVASLVKRELEANRPGNKKEEVIRK